MINDFRRHECDQCHKTEETILVAPMPKGWFAIGGRWYMDGYVCSRECLVNLIDVRYKALRSKFDSILDDYDKGK